MILGIALVLEVPEAISAVTEATAPARRRGTPRRGCALMNHTRFGDDIWRRSA